MFVPFIVIGVIALIVVAARRQHERVAATWSEAARRLGVQVEAGSWFSNPKLDGTLNGIPLHVDSYTRRHGNNSTTYTRYQVRFPPPGFDYTLRREGGLTKIGKFFGIRDVEVGDAAFDGAFKIKTDDQTRLEQLLTPSVRAGLFRLMASFPSVVISAGHIGMEQTRLEKNPDKLESIVRRLVGAAQLLASPTGGVSDEDVTDRQHGMLEDVADRVRHSVDQNPEDVDQRLCEIETLAAAGDDQQAGQRLGELEKMAPADPDVVGWRKTLETPGRTPAAARDVDLDEMAADLFGGDDLSFETRTKFNSKYAGANVTWEGTVKEVRESRTGTRVTVTVATVENDLYGNTDIDVVVETTGPAPAKGAEVTVSGMLDRIDPLMRNLYLAAARID
jgi:hypothetical protein